VTPAARLADLPPDARAAVCAQVARNRARMPAAPANAPGAAPSAGAVTVTLPEPPSANRWWRHVGDRVLLSREARAYKQHVATLLGTVLRLRPVAPPTLVRVDVTWYRGRRSGDLDKRLGVLLDALQGTAYESDAQVAALSAERIDRPRDPGVAVTITPLPPP
jgi:Holliday junction resolvase RusA-like endonuclease